MKPNCNRNNGDSMTIEIRTARVGSGQISHIFGWYGIITQGCTRYRIYFIIDQPIAVAGQPLARFTNFHGHPNAAIHLHAPPAVELTKCTLDLKGA